MAQSFYKKYGDMVEGIIMIGSCPYNPSYYSRSDLFWLRQTKWMFGLFPDRLLRNTMARMGANTRRARQNMLNMLSDFTKEELCRLMYIGFAGFIPEIVKMNIKCPIWLLADENDKTGKVMTYNKLWHKKEGLPLYIIKGAAHNANDDRPSQVNKLIKEFLQAL